MNINNSDSLQKNNSLIYRLIIVCMCLVFLFNLFYDDIFRIVVADKLQVFKSPERLHELGMEAMENEEYADAIEYFTWEVQKDKDATDAYYNLGEIYIGAGRYDEAIEIYRRVLEIDYLDEKANLGIVMSEIQLKKVDNALLELDRIIENDEDFTEAYLYRAVIYNLSGEKEKAAEDLDKVIELEPDNVEAWILRSGILVELNRYDEGTKGYEYIISNFADTDEINEIYRIVTALYYEMGEYTKCAEYADKVLEANLKDAEIIAMRAESHLALEEYTAATEDYMLYIQAVGQTDEAYNSLGHCQYLAQDYENSLESFKTAHELSPSGQASYNMALALTALQRYEEAIEAYDEAIALDENNTKLYKLRAYVYGDMQNFEKTIKELEFYLDMEPDDTEALFNLGLSYYNNQEFESALDVFTRLIAIENTNYEAYYYRGVCYSVLEEHTNAVEDYKMALSGDFLPAECNYNIAIAYLNLEQYEDALVYLESAKELTDNEEMRNAIDSIIDEVKIIM